MENLAKERFVVTSIVPMDDGGTTVTGVYCPLNEMPWPAVRVCGEAGGVVYPGTGLNVTMYCPTGALVNAALVPEPLYVAGPPTSATVNVAVARFVVTRIVPVWGGGAESVTWSMLPELKIHSEPSGRL